MHVPKTPSRRWRWAALLVAAGLAGAAVAGQSQAAAVGAPVFTAAQLSEGLLFKDGPAAQYLSSLKREPVRWTDQLRQAEKAMDAAVSRDPKWAASFAGRIQSGDPNQVRAALSDFSVLAQGVLENLFGADAIERAAQLIHDGIADQLIDDSQVLDNMVQLDKDIDSAFAYIAVETRDTGMDNVAVYETDTAVAVQHSTAMIWSETVSFAFTKGMPSPDEKAVYQEAQMLQELLVRTITQNLQSAR